MQGRYRSFFWPAVLILAGIAALLVNTGVISADRLILLVNLWPLVLIVIGLEIIVRRTWQGAAADVAGALIVILAIAGSIGYVVLAPNAAQQTTDLSAPLAGEETASLELHVAAATIDMSGSGDLGNKLFTARVLYTGQGPTMAESNGAVIISDRGDGGPLFHAERLKMDVRLNATLPWRLTIDSGATTDHLDLTSVHLTSLSLDTAASHDDVTLGAPSAIVPITFNGAAMTVNVHRPSGVPVSIAVSGAGIRLNADGRHMSGLGDLGYQTSDFAGAQNAYRIEVDGAACTVTLDKTQAFGSR